MNDNEKQNETVKSWHHDSNGSSPDLAESRDDRTWENKMFEGADVERSISPVDGTDDDVGEEPVNSRLIEAPAEACFFWRIFSTDPAIVLAYFAINLSGTVFQNQLLYQACTVVFDYSNAECEPLLGIVLGNNASSQAIENIVQPYVVQITNVRSYISAVVPAIFLLFIGPWTDRFGRRMVLLTTFVGFFFNYLIACIMCWVALDKSFSPWLYVITVIPSALTGNSCIMLTMIFCYISDAYDGRFRAIRMFYNDAAMGIGLVIGNSVSSALFAATNMATVFAVAAGAMLLAFAYIYFMAKEILVAEEAPFWAKIRSFFDYKLVKDLVLTCVEKRPEHGRTFIWLAMVAVILTSFVSTGETNVVYLFVRRKFAWTLATFSTFNSITSGIQIIGGVCGMVILRKILNISVVMLAVYSLLSCVLQSTVRAAAAYAWEMYLASGLGFFSGILNPMLLAILSHLAAVTELGKIYALTNCLSTLAPLAAAPLYSSVYTATLTYYPGFYNIISVILYLIAFGLIAAIFGIRMARGYKANV